LDLSGSAIWAGRSHEIGLNPAFKLTAYDRDHSRTEELIQYGGTVRQSVSELSSSCSVCVVVPTERRSCPGHL